MIVPLCSVSVLFLVAVPHACFEHQNNASSYMSREERESLKKEAAEMFYHAYNSYMDNAYPADELMPLSCTGRYRGSHASRGNVDEALGNFSLTLIDSLDTLVILGNITEFEKAIKLVIEDVTFDNDVIVSVFETNIRVLGGLLSAHILADYLKESSSHLGWYNGELLEMAKDLGYRLLPAFNTTTGLPYSRVNLRRDITKDQLEWCCDTCTACAGTMILEWAALSRLTGIPIFEEKAHMAMDKLWSMRHRTSNLMGTILNVNSGDWIRRDSGVGAGIDSYYEYCLKAYILLSDEKYLNRFNTHYSAIMTYISQGPMLLDVHMHKPELNSKNFMDALLAFWPGLQVLTGDIKPAVQTHEMLYQVMQKHKFIPEAFTTDFQVHWGQHPLRPEFIESTYFLYHATGDPYYLQVGRTVLKALQTYARVPCGFASVSDVRTGVHEDSMDSFVLAETFKYLYLLFADPSDLLIKLDDYIFTTEAHLLPLSISRTSVTNYSYVSPGGSIETETVDQNQKFPKSCKLNTDEVADLRKGVKNIVGGLCPNNDKTKKLAAVDFQARNENHVKQLSNMGISVIFLSDGKVQLHHSFSKAASRAEGEDGVSFMQEMIRLSKMNMHENTAMLVTYETSGKIVMLTGGPAHFGKLLQGSQKVKGKIGVAEPSTGCDVIVNSADLQDRIVIVERGDCMFVDKARRIQKAGALAGIVVDNIADSSADTWPLFAMSGDGSSDDLRIPFVFLFTKEAKQLIQAATDDPNLIITLSEKIGKESLSSIPESGKTEETFRKLRETIKDLFFSRPPIQEKPRDNQKYECRTESLKVTLDQKSENKYASPLTQPEFEYDTADKKGHDKKEDEEYKSTITRVLSDYSTDSEYVISGGFNSDLSKLFGEITASTENFGAQQKLDLKNEHKTPMARVDEEFPKTENSENPNSDNDGVYETITVKELSLTGSGYVLEKISTRRVRKQTFVSPDLSSEEENIFKSEETVTDEEPTPFDDPYLIEQIKSIQSRSVPSKDIDETSTVVDTDANHIDKDEL